MAGPGATEIDAAAVQAALASLREPDGSPSFAEDEIADVISEGDWTGVVIGKEDTPRELLVKAHALLTTAFPGVEFELRAGNPGGCAPASPPTMNKKGQERPGPTAY